MYPADANQIVSLLDIHANAFSTPLGNGPSLEILEAGTGHGALTLHLARAIHAANASIPSFESSRESLVTQYLRDMRQAIIHTVDVSPQYSNHAKKVVQGFRQGLYSNDIDFYVSNVSDWIDQQFSHRQLREQEDRTFLSHVILDMPNSYQHIEKVASALRPQGNLMLFNPSITQITAAVETIRKTHIPVYLDRVLEVGPTMTGGKQWDIRAVKPRALVQAEHERRFGGHIKDSTPENAVNENVASSIEHTSDEGSDATILRNTEKAEALAKEQQGFEMICRPKPFARVVGGGFLGLWKKQSPRDV